MKFKSRKPQKRFIFCISEELLKEIKVKAATRNISMSAWITKAIILFLYQEQMYD